MTSIALTNPPAEMSAKTKARLAGFIYLIIIVFGAYAQLGIRDQIVVAGNAVATAQNIMSHELLYRMGFTIEVFYLLCGVVLKFLLWDIFKVVNRKLAIVMILFAAIGAAIQSVILLAHYAPLVLLSKSADSGAFSVLQMQTAAYLSLRIFDYGYMIALSFFGCFCLVLSYLIVKSTFFPRFVGPILAFEGVAYLMNSFGHFISPPFGDRVVPFLLVSALGEISFCLCLLFVGVNLQRWTAQALESSGAGVGQ